METDVDPKAAVKLNDKQTTFFEKCKYKKTDESTLSNDITIEDVVECSSKESKNEDYMKEIKALKAVIESQNNKIEHLEEQLASQKDADENDITVESKQKKRKRVSTGESIMNVTLMEDSANKDIEIHNLKEENARMKQEIALLKNDAPASSTSSALPKNWDEEPVQSNVHSLVMEMQSNMDKRFADMQELIEKSIFHENVAQGNSYVSILKKGADEEGGSKATIHKPVLSKQVSNFREIITAAKNEELAEEKEKSMRENNIIIHGVSEENPENNVKDLQFFKTLSKDLCIGSINFKSISRIGQEKESKKRPIKVSLMNKLDKEKILKNLVNLKGKREYNGISVTYDYTQSERRMIRDFVSKAAEQNNTELPDSNMKWVVKGNPKNGLYLKKVAKKPQVQAQPESMLTSA